MDLSGCNADAVSGVDGFRISYFKKSICDQYSSCNYPAGNFWDLSSLDGANTTTLLWKIGVPIGKGGIVSVAVLDFLECINSIEAPLVFIRDKSLLPLSLFFPAISSENVGEVFAASIIIMIPAVLVFFLGDEYLETGLQAFQVKS